jgi:DNA-directed RNA polymerase subunit RPC12/RpoP
MPICLECGQEFEKSYRQQKCCSPECQRTRFLRQKAKDGRRNREAKRRAGKKNRKALPTGATDTRHHGDNWTLTPEEREAMGLRPLNPGMRPCANCGEEFYSWDRSRNVLCILCCEEATNCDTNMLDSQNQGRPIKQS